MTIKTKLIVSFILLIFFAGLIFLLASINMSGLNKRINRIADSTAQKIKHGARVNREIINIAQAEKDLILTESSEEMERLIRQIEQKQLDVESRLKFISDNSEEEGKNIINNFSAKWNAYLGNLASVQQLALANTNTKARAISNNEVLTALNKSQSYLEKITDDLRKSGDNNMAFVAFEISSLLTELYSEQKNMISQRDMERMLAVEQKTENLAQKLEMLSAKLSNNISGSNKTLLDNFNRQYDKFLDYDKEVKRLTKENSNIKAFDLANTIGKKLHDDALAEMVKLVDLNDNQLTIDKENSDTAYASANLQMIVILILSTVISILIAWWIITTITSGINNAKFVVGRVAKGDFSKDVEINSKDEIGEMMKSIQYMIIKIRGSVELAQKIADGNLTMDLKNDKNREGDLDDALEQMLEKLKEVAITIRTGADNIASASHQVSSSSQQLAEGSQEQASSTQEASSAMEQMSANIQQSKDNAQQTNAMATKAAEDIRNSRDHVNESVKAIDLIAEKISVISEIASKTDLLALNAAVEAARAGEHGKGFAVVAAEVRKLAERSQKAAIEIDEISVATVEKARKSGKMLNDVVPDIEKTAELIKEISASSIEQSTGSEQVNSSLQQLSEVIQENASASEELASSSEELNSQAEEMKAAVGFFKLSADNNGASTFDKTPFRGKTDLERKQGQYKTSSQKEAGFELEMNESKSSNGKENFDDKDFEQFQ
ncbi:MCP four helix bundle domain-containing protein [Marivirga sp. S37H4]|uniref:MCP four helix bundle domain-containing protein n=1 Tax=Marivirga aurantiaca TaxID=2802615 RepID=A0A934WWU1_9BACT|nr:methyl-accepting chemotaxis protein [Marivirga aurantiaca]MBK6264554.1 MCP four helix bundle domain-containing protein [Marivirga aurantiaca]